MSLEQILNSINAIYNCSRSTFGFAMNEYEKRKEYFESVLDRESIKTINGMIDARDALTGLAIATKIKN